MEKEHIRSMVDNLLNNQEAEAMNNFDTAISVKLTDALDAKRVEIASSLGQPTYQEEDFEDENI